MGLLGNGWDDPQSSAIMALSGGLLQGNFGAGLVGANNAYAQAKEDAFKRQYAQMQMADMEAQRQQRLAAAQKEQAALLRQQQIQAGIPGLFQAPGMTGGAPQPQTEGGIPMFSRPLGVTPMQSTPGGFDVQGAIRLGMDPDAIKKYAELPNIGKPKVARTVKGMGPDGREFEYQVDEFGNKVGEGMPQYRAPISVNQGNRTTFADPYSLKPVGAFQTYQSPDSAASNATAMRGQNMTDARARESNAAGKIPAGYRMKMDGTMEAIPGGPADIKAGAEGQKKVGDAKDVLGLLDEVDKLLPKATGSYLGAGVDQAARVIGKSTPGSEATAQLQALQGALIGKMPKMSGPQSDKDVQLYREMAGQVADSTLPVAQRQKASATIRSLNEKYAGMPEGSSKPTKQVVRTGVYGGRKVVQYADGTTAYAD